MSLSEDGKAERKLKAIRRAQFRLAQRLQAIDWEFDVLMPEIRNLKAGNPVMGLESGIALEFVADDENHSQTEDASDKPTE